MKRVLLVLAFAVLALGCKRQKPPVAKRIWLSQTGGCMETLPHPVTGTFACWGSLAGEEPRPVASRYGKEGRSAPTELALSGPLPCKLEGNELSCWSLPPLDEDRPNPKTKTISGKVSAMAGGPLDTCIGSSEGMFCTQRLRHATWPAGSVRAVAVGTLHACAAYEGGLGVVCKGDASSIALEARADEMQAEMLAELGATAPVKRVPVDPNAAQKALDLALGEPGALAGLDVTRIAAGEGHTCAVLANRTVRCWGKNDSGQLGDRTKNDSKLPVEVLGLNNVARIVAGRAHTCALQGNGTVHCWGDNTHHQLANGGTTNEGRAQMVLGILGVSAIASAGDASCAILSSDGAVRCWGQNDKGQLGDPTLQEHTVPAPVRFH